ncbi:hypothetical protein [Bradyrhizobium liaoningense]
MNRGQSVRPVIIAASPGGHLTQLLLMTREINPKLLLTYDDRREVAEGGEFLARCSFPNTRYNLLIHAYNFVRFCLLVLKYRPVALISTGGPFVLSFFAAARLLRIRTLYVDTLSRVTQVSGTCKLLLKLRLSDEVFVQWPHLVEKIEGVSYHGSLFNMRHRRHPEPPI